MRKTATTLREQVLSDPGAPCLPLRAPEAPPAPLPIPPPRGADRIKDALLRWLEEEMP